MDLKHKAALITGASRGLGAAMAEGLAARGMSLALIDLDAEGLARTEAACAAHGVKALCLTASVADEAEIAGAYARAVAELGRLDVSIANAGILRDGLLVSVKDGKIEGELSLADWQAVIDVNLTGVYLCGREAAKQMIRSGNGGCIINISSISRHGNFGQSNYSAAKAGVAALTVVWAKELARHGIRVNAIAPGFVKTHILDTMRPELVDKLVAGIPARRLGQPAEITKTVEFILDNEYVDGRVIDVDGGLRI